MSKYDAEIALMPHVHDLRYLAMRLYGADDSISVPRGPNDATLREIVVTPYSGAYGLAGYVVAVNGSPPRGMFVTAAYGKVIYITADCRSRRMLKEQACIVWTYLEQEGYRRP